MGGRSATMKPRTSIERAIDKANEKPLPGAGKLRFDSSVPFGGGEDVQVLWMDNGLRVLLLVDKSAPVVAYSTWFRVGSRHEKTGKTGLAHLFEHLMFNETEHLRAGEFDRKLEEAGAESNAATWVDWTYYYEAVPKDRVGLVIDLEADRMAHLVLRDAQVASEREVVANERRYRVDDDVEGIASEVLYRTAFQRHNYGWPTIGWMADILGFVPADCEAFYRTYYAPNNATVVVVGDIREADVLARLRKAYGALPRADIPAEDTFPEPPQLEERVVVLRKPTATEKLVIGWHGPALGDPDHAPLTVLSEILFGGRASRAQRSMMIDHELVTEVRGWASTFRDPGLFEVTATARPGKTKDELLGALDREIARLHDAPPSEAELERAKARLELGGLQALDTATGKAEQIGFFDTVTADPAGAFRRLEAYRRVTAGDVRRVARRFLVSRARTIVHVVPETGGEPRSEAS
jgi:zinc protease